MIFVISAVARRNTTRREIANQMTTRTVHVQGTKVFIIRFDSRRWYIERNANFECMGYDVAVRMGWKPEEPAGYRRASNGSKRV